MSATLAFQQLSVAQGQTSASISGSVSLSALITQSNVQVSLSVGADSLTVAAASSGYSDTIVYEAGMQITLNETSTSPSSLNATLNGSFTANSIGGRVTITTLQPITQLASDTYPSAGQVRVTGSGGSQLRITVIDNTQVRLELDAGGDGSYEGTTVVPWGSLRSV